MRAGSVLPARESQATWGHWAWRHDIESDGRREGVFILGFRWPHLNKSASWSGVRLVSRTPPNEHAHMSGYATALWAPASERLRSKSFMFVVLYLPNSPARFWPISANSPPEICEGNPLGITICNLATPKAQPISSRFAVGSQRYPVCPSCVPPSVRRDTRRGRKTIRFMHHVSLGSPPSS